MGKGVCFDRSWWMALRFCWHLASQHIYSRGIHCYRMAGWLYHRCWHSGKEHDFLWDTATASSRQGWTELALVLARPSWLHDKLLLRITAPFAFAVPGCCRRCAGPCPRWVRIAYPAVILHFPHTQHFSGHARQLCISSVCCVEDGCQGIQ